MTVRLKPCNPTFVVNLPLGTLTQHDFRSVPEKLWHMIPRIQRSLRCPKSQAATKNTRYVVVPRRCYCERQSSSSQQLGVALTRLFAVEKKTRHQQQKQQRLRVSSLSLALSLSYLWLPSIMLCGADGEESAAPKSRLLHLGRLS